MSFKLNFDQKTISENDFGIPQNWETFRYLSNFKFLRVSCDEIWLDTQRQADSE